MAARVLLLGGIGSGKSTAAAWFRSHGALVINADLVARQVIAPGTDGETTVLAMWPEVRSEDGTIDRLALFRAVFEDPAELAALESITHPATRAAIREEVAAHPDDIVFVEMALLRDWFDESWIRIVVDAPEETRVERAVGRQSALTEADVRLAMSRQATREEFLLAADFVLDNSGTPQDLESECERVWSSIPAT